MASLTRSARARHEAPMTLLSVEPLDIGVAPGWPVQVPR